jgi:CheY-like chemotaxis protein
VTKPLALIIEDDAELADIFSVGLEGIGFETEIARDGKMALARLATVVPVLVLLDLHLPGVSGKDILKHIRANDRLAGTRVVLATADALMAQSLRGEADLILLKPISINHLRSVAKRLLTSS